MLNARIIKRVQSYRERDLYQLCRVITRIFNMLLNYIIMYFRLTSMDSEPSTSNSAPWQHDTATTSPSSRPEHQLDLLPFEQTLMMETFDEDVMIITAR